MSLSLYKIADEIAAIVTADELTEESLDALDRLEMSLAQKVGNIHNFRAMLIGMVAAAKEEEDRLKKRRKAAENRIAQLDSYVLRCLQSAGREEIDAGTVTAKIKKSPGVLVIENEENIPGKFIVTKMQHVIDRVAIKNAIKSGECVDSCRIDKPDLLAYK